MKNHFIISYFGNKRNEVDDIIDVCNFDGIEYIVEPYCGTCAFSFRLSQLYPGKFKYILNDNNKFLVELLEIMKDDNRYNNFRNNINELITTIDTKQKYKDIVNNKTLEGWFIASKFYEIRPGIYPLRGKPFKELNETYPIIHFLKTENIELNNIDALDIIIKYKDEKNKLIFIDPPYLQSCNDYYEESGTNIYQYLYSNPPQNFNAYFVFALEYIWINKLLFKDCIDKSKCLIKNKTYEAKKKKTEHFYFTNKI